MKNNVEEKIIAEGWILKQEYTNAGLKLYQSPWDGKYHIYDDYAEELLDKAFDRIENVFSNYNNIYLVVTLNGKQGLYHYSNYKKGKGFMTKIEYDYIESLSTLLVFTKEGKKRFAYVYDEEKLSEEFDDITMDENHKNLIYCKKENTIHVFDTRKQDFLFSMNVEELSNLYENTFWIFTNNHRLNEYLFKTKKDGQYNLTKVRIECEGENKKNVEIQTLPKEEYCEVYKLEKDGKQGLYDPARDIKIEAVYDKIVSLCRPNAYALFHDGVCDIGRITSKGFVPYITDCVITHQFGNELMDILIYQKDGKQGLLLMDNIHNKVIPPEYEEIKIGKQDGQNLFVTLKKDGKYKVAKMSCLNSSEPTYEFEREESFDLVEFYPDLIIAKNQEHTYLYDYQRGLLTAFSSNILVQYFEDEDTQSRFYFAGTFYYHYKDGQIEKQQRNRIPNNEHYSLNLSLYP